MAADPSTQTTIDLLRAYESQNVTLMAEDGSWPIVWQRAEGVTVWDAEGNEYLDLTAAFGVAATGHANKNVVAAGQRQMGVLLHAMGDVHPHAGKALLAQALSDRTFARWTTGTSNPTTGKVVFCNAGFEAVEVAMKTAALATRRPGVIAFSGAYHGLGYGTLNVTDKSLYRGPFGQQLRGFGHFVPFPTTDIELEFTIQSIHRLCKEHSIGAVLAEPVQGRGGIRIPPPTFVSELRRVCDDDGLVLIVDEIFTGFGRTGRWFAVEHSATVPDVVCLGKGLTGGFPLSACVGRASLMDGAWPPATGDPIHTTTYMAHPVGCAMALAQIAEIENADLVNHAANLGRVLSASLERLQGSARRRVSTRSIGLLGGIEFLTEDGAPDSSGAIRVVEEMLRRGFILLPDGVEANVVTLSPPLTITEPELLRALSEIADVIGT